MKKPYAKRLQAIAEKLPLKWTQEDDYVWMTAEEMRLTIFADVMTFEDGREYKVWVPKFTAVFHEQQVKDAFKRGGSKAVQEYVNSVTQ